jgi:signal transduction histidine kinase
LEVALLTLEDPGAWLNSRGEVSRHPTHSRWMRARALGAPERNANAASALGRSALAVRRERFSPVLIRANDVLGDAITELNRRGFVVGLADQEGFLLRCWGAQSFEQRRVRAGFAEGSCWSEAARGTNAIGTALAERISVAVLGRAHYASDAQGLVCYASLIRDPLSSSVGVLDVTGPCEAADPLLGVLVESLATSLESSLAAEVDKRSRDARAARSMPIGPALARMQGRVLGEGDAGHGPSRDDEASVWAEIGALAIDAFADFCMIDVIADDRYIRMHISTGLPHKRAVAAGLGRYTLDASRSYPALTALRTRRSILVPALSSSILDDIAQDAEHARLLREMEPASLIAVPILCSSGPIGVMTLVSSVPGLRYGQSEVDLAEMLAGYAALTCENAGRVQSLRRNLSLRDDVLAMVAHDLRNPISAISISADSLEQRLAAHAHDAGADSRSVQAIARSTQRMSRMVDDLLEVARAETGRLTVTLQRCSVAELMHACADLAHATAAGLHLVSECDAAAGEVLADRDRTLQVFANLIGNAAKFTPEAGTLTLGCARHGHRVHFWVRDSGPGISREHLARVFERGFQAQSRDRRGAGLGLYICKALVEAQGGAIWAESEAGHGATFYFSLPAV